MEKKKNHQDIYVGIGSLIFVAWVLFLVRKLPFDSALMTYLLCGLLAVLGTLILIGGIRKTAAQKPEEMKPLLDKDGIQVPFTAWLFVLGYVLLFYLIGYFLATLIMLIALMRYMKRTDWKMIIAITVIYLVFIYAVFVKQFGLPLSNFGMIGNMLT